MNFFSYWFIYLCIYFSTKKLWKEHVKVTIDFVSGVAGGVSGPPLEGEER